MVGGWARNQGRGFEGLRGRDGSVVASRVRGFEGLIGRGVGSVRGSRVRDTTLGSGG